MVGRGRTMKSINDCFTLNNGMEIPCMGFGTFRGADVDCDVKKMVLDAIEVGHRYFDTASLYGTEVALGQAIKESGIPREEFFIVTKLWTDEMGYENAKRACAESLERLQMDYLDLYLIHWPKQDEADTNWKTLDIETWKALEDLVDEGKTKGIGLSNFLPHHIENLKDIWRIKPVVNQLEIHPGYSQEAAITYCQANDIQVQAWSPLGRSRILEDPYMLQLAEKYNVTVPQICLKFILQKGVIPLPKSANIERMKNNCDLFSFEINSEDMWQLSTMPQTLWLGQHPDFVIPKKARLMK